MSELIPLSCFRKKAGGINSCNNLRRALRSVNYALIKTMSKAKILVVDNDKDMCWLIASILKEEGLCVDIAHDVKSALAKINQHPYEAMVLDYKLSGMSGLTVLEKTHQIKPPIVTIMISAFGDGPTRARAQELGVYAFLDKPFDDIDRLKKTVKKALREQKSRCISEADLQSRHSGSSSNGCGVFSFGKRESREIFK